MQRTKLRIASPLACVYVVASDRLSVNQLEVTAMFVVIQVEDLKIITDNTFILSSQTPLHKDKSFMCRKSRERKASDHQAESTKNLDRKTWKAKEATAIRHLYSLCLHGVNVSILCYRRGIVAP